MLSYNINSRKWWFLFQCFWGLFNSDSQNSLKSITIACCGHRKVMGEKFQETPVVAACFSRNAGNCRNFLRNTGIFAANFSADPTF